MTTTGFLVGALAGVGIIAITLVVALVWIARKVIRNPEIFDMDGAEKEPGFAVFKKTALAVLTTAPVQSHVSAKLPIPSPEFFIRVAGKKAGVNSYSLEIRLGYKRTDHLNLVEGELSKIGLEFTRKDNGRGSIKIVSEKVSSIEELLSISSTLRTAFTYDLDDNGIKVHKTLRKQA